MSKKYSSFLKKTLIILTFFLAVAFPGTSLAQSAGTDLQIELNVFGCTYDGVCDKSIGENYLTCPSECPLLKSTGAWPAREDVFFKNVLVTVFVNKVVITWQSSLPTVDTVKWGKTIDYGDGLLRTIIFTKDHRIAITELEPDTLYYAYLSSTDLFNRSVDYGMIPFRTFPMEGFMKNPTYFRATPTKKGILLSWINPEGNNFSYERLTRNNFKFPEDPFSGLLLYEGREENFLDEKVEKGKEYFYALYSRSTAGNFSSGVFASAIFEAQKTKPRIYPPPPSEKETETGPGRKSIIWSETGEFVYTTAKSICQLIWTLILAFVKKISIFFTGLYIIIRNLIISLF